MAPMLSGFPEGAGRPESPCRQAGSRSSKSSTRSWIQSSHPTRVRVPTGRQGPWPAQELGERRLLKPAGIRCGVLLIPPCELALDRPPWLIGCAHIDGVEYTYVVNPNQVDPRVAPSRGRAAGKRPSSQLRGHSGEIDRPFRWQVDHLSERSDTGRNHEVRFSVRVDGRPRFRMESPFSSSL